MVTELELSKYCEWYEKTEGGTVRSGFKQLSLGNNSDLDTCLYVIFVSQ